MFVYCAGPSHYLTPRGLSVESMVEMLSSVLTVSLLALRGPWAPGRSQELLVSKSHFTCVPDTEFQK